MGKSTREPLNICGPAMERQLFLCLRSLQAYCAPVVETNDANAAAVGEMIYEGPRV
jgi:hypothetical protein